MATGDSYPRSNEPMRPGAVSGTSAPTTGASGASTAGSSYGGGMHAGLAADDRPSTGDSGPDNPKEAMGQVADQAQQKLMQAAETAQEQAKSQLGGQLGQVGEALGSVADAMNSVGKQLRENDQGHLAGLADQAAQRVERFIGDDAPDAGHQQQCRQAVEGDLRREVQQGSVVGYCVEQRCDQRPSRFGVGARPPPGDLAGLIGDGAE